ncbi:hypothetical protein CTI12_AA271210 [Artemisia annua]|uniref:DUF4220 domain-containing protein n=1 Tax=Artemisia annua TaxID=35608 RepID=A0A2U1NFH2_ARTAN|nr:hypothetical protein CTI12_AA271210 [Artemisia annua]
MRRMMIDIPPKWKLLWDTWNLRGSMIFSLSLQTLLILFAPIRKRSSSYWIIMPLWSIYLLADWVANFSIGLIMNSKGNHDMEEDLLAFWAPFLLVHLGGPDTITAFALEDNEFWLRHLISLVIQCLATVYVFVQSLPHNQLWIPTLLMFMNGTIKYAERTRAFYLASADRFKWSMNTHVHSEMNYMELMERYLLQKKPCLITTKTGGSANEAKNGDLTKLEVVQYAYYFFNTFKGLVVDLIFSRKTRNQSRDFFLHRTAKDAFEVVEVELNFMYEILFTKIPVVYSRFGAICRIFSLATVCSAIVLFISKSKSQFRTIDVTITYGLLFNALTLDIVALLMLVFSKKTVIFLLKRHVLNEESPWTRILSVFRFHNMKGVFRMRTSEAHEHRWPIGFFKRRWSESIPTYNLIYCCLHPYSKFYEKLGVTNFVDYIKYVKSKRFPTHLRDFIFQELKLKSELADDLETAMEMSSSRGDWVLRADVDWSRLIPYTLDGDYGQRILLWHIATNLCYNKELNHKLKTERDFNTNNDHHRENAKMLSDYMLYLLIMKPSMMSALSSTVQTKFLDICSDVTCIFKSGKLHEVNEVRKQTQGSKDIEVDWEQLHACMKIFDIPDDVWLRNVKGDLKKSLLLYGFILAKEIMKIEEEDQCLNKWLIISKVWIELLCYGASHSHAKIQASQVSKGGELITIVWMLMAHFGLGDQFQINEYQKKARHVID